MRRLTDVEPRGAHDDGGMSSPLHRREIHDRALMDLEDGAVTPSNQAELSKLARALNTLLAGLVVSSLQFEQHAHLVRGAYARPLADFLRECADGDRLAARSVGERIHRLGFRADYDPRLVADRSHVPFTTFEEDRATAVVTQNLIGVRILVQSLQEAIRWTGLADPGTRNLFEQVLADKERQADVLSATARP